MSEQRTPLPTTEIAPGFLVAAPNMPDFRFESSVILMVHHDTEGALGFVINQNSTVPLRTLLDHLDDELVEEAARRGLSDQTILVGGPVQPSSFWIVFEKSTDDVFDAESLDATLFDLGPAIGAANSLVLLEEFVRGERAGRFMVLAGYSGWGPGQLEDELGVGSWLPVGLDPAIVFDTPMEDRWEAALKALGLTPGGFIMSGSGGMA